MKQGTSAWLVALALLASTPAAAGNVAGNVTGDIGDRASGARPWDEGWSFGVHAGRSIDNSVHTGEAFLPWDWDFEDYYLTSAGLRKEVARLWRHSRVLAEMDLAWVGGDEEYAEAALTPMITWDTFPWDRTVDTTLAVGAGLSYSSKTTEIDTIDQRWMASMIFELEMQPAGWASWSVYTRIHHRSNAFGLFGDESSQTGSNFPSLGVRYYF
uniref:hypothetical protein n=1 Tax=uncultured Halomonas sp. TaxID=173971 RepID=UPI00263913A5|nr:hypothetical protein [uncultured Halomonas sp.]